MFQEIYEIISVYLPKKWKKIAFYASVTDNSIGCKFYVHNGKEYLDCYDLGYDESEIIKSLLSIQNILINERKNLEKEKRFTEFEMLIDSTGKFNVNYGYEDISETKIQRELDWVNKNIRGGK